VIRSTGRRAAAVVAFSVVVGSSVSFGAAAAHAAPACKRQCPPADTLAPVVSVANPGAGSTVNGVVTVSGSASDNVALAKVEVAVDAGPFKAATGTASWSTTVDSRTYANGGHTIVARATDGAGNVASKSVAVTVANATADLTPPTVAVASPSAGATVAGAVVISGTAADNVAVARVEVGVDGGAWSQASGAASWTWNWSSASAANGSHSISARATDTAGNTVTKTVTVTSSNNADTTAPGVSVSAPQSGASVAGAVTVAGNSTDNVAVASVRTSVDGGAWSQANGTTTWSWSWDTTVLANGSHTVAAQAIDGAGNVSATVVTPVNVANGPAPLGSCSDGAPVLEQTVTAEGVRIAVCTSVGGWTTTSVNNLLKPNALDLAVVGPHLTIQIQTGGPSSEGSSASCCDAGGNYYGYGAVMILNPSSSSSFSAAPDALMAHEYGHAWTYYWHYMNPANQGRWAAYDSFRWAAANGTQVLANSPSLNSSYSWMDYEMAADDYRRLFGTPAAQSQLAFLNSNVPDSRAVTGLADFFLNTWR
jgi:hypothetical protein